MPTVTIPHKFKPRHYQIPFFKAIDSGIKRAVLIHPRRSGKDKSCYNGLIKKAVERVGNYYYMFPEYNQGRKALWDNIDGSGFRTIHHAPDSIVKTRNATEMKIELVNGSIIQIVGASDVDRIVGSNPAGVVFSEYSLIDPLVWGYIYPILAENGGFAWFNFTPRGDNHAKEMYIKNKDKEDWFVQKLTAKECGVFTEDQLNVIKQEYYDLYSSYDLFEQEFNTSFAAPLQGSYYGDTIKRLDEDKRITSVPYDASVPVFTSWDLGVNDTTAIWFMQAVGKEIHVIDHYETSGEPLRHYVGVINSKGYTYSEHVLPHDARARELQSGKSREQALRDLGINNLRILERTDVMDGIEVARSFLSRCWFDEKKCDRGLKCLRNYHKEFDEKNKVWRNRPKHDWSSNSADSFRYAAVGFKEVTPTEVTSVGMGASSLIY